ncbi:MAG TPA: glycosyltransferase family A protein [Ferruginibacter sp.]|nr:glycosyltransferase family A protein [Ferruginibacter sp.]
MNERSNMISIIVPCYNYGHYVVEMLNSVVEQTYTNWECIIINDGSTDNSKQIIENYIKDDKRFTFINSENAGVSVARNMAIAQAKGKYIFPLDADNKLYPDCLLKCITVFEKEPATKLVHTEAQLFGDENRLWQLPSYDYKTMLHYNMVDNSCLFLKEDFNRVGGYRINMVNGLEDWDFFIALLAPYSNDQVVKINEPLYYYRVDKRSRRSTLENTHQFDLMLDNIIYNNYSIYQKYYPNIFERIQKYDYYNTIMNKPSIKFIVQLHNKLHKLKQYFRKK